MIPAHADARRARRARRCCATSAAALPGGAGVKVGVGDDAAAVEIGPVALVTTDCLVEGVHFTRDSAPRAARRPQGADRQPLGHRRDGRASAATRPSACCCRPTSRFGWVDALYDGLLERAAEAGVSIVGGNLARSREGVVVDVTLLGDAGAAAAAQRRAPGRPRGGDGHARGRGRGRAAAEGGRAARRRRPSSGATGVWTESSAAAVVACLRAQLDPRPPFAVARSIAERGLARGGHGPLGRPVDATSSRCARRAASRRWSSARCCRSTRRRRAWRGRAAAIPRARAPRRRGLPAAARGRARGARRSARARPRVRRGAHAGRRASSRASRRCACATPRAERPLAPGGHDHFRAARRRLAGRPCAGCAGRLRSCSRSRTAPRAWRAAFGLGVFIAFFPLLGIHTGLALLLAIAAAAQPRRDPGRRLDQQPLDARADVQRRHAAGLRRCSAWRPRARSTSTGTCKGRAFYAALVADAAAAGVAVRGGEPRARASWPGLVAFLLMRSVLVRRAAARRRLERRRELVVRASPPGTRRPAVAASPPRTGGPRAGGRPAGRRRGRTAATARAGRRGSRAR